MHICVMCVSLPVILSLEELELLLDTVQSFQDCELERLARLQGNLHGEKIKILDAFQKSRCACV